jgi:glycosyltransferase involved in cell wall biosynthesis
MINKVFMLKSNKNWILGAIVKESARALNSSIDIAYIPETKKDFLTRDAVIFYYKYLKCYKSRILIVNQSTLFRMQRLKLSKRRLKNYSVLYTHDSEGILPLELQTKVLNEVDRIMLFNTESQELLIGRGVIRNKSEVIFGAVDREYFYPQINSKEGNRLKSKESYILISSDCKPRKSPELIFEVIKRMPKTRFVIHGNGWNTYLEPKSLKNLSVYEFKFENQPGLVRNAHAYLTLSELEGGPYPTLEALASGTPVVATNTGWNREVIGQESGFVLPVNPPVELVIESLNKCLLMKEKTRFFDLLESKYNWHDFGMKLFK